MNTMFITFTCKLMSIVSPETASITKLEMASWISMRGMNFTVLMLHTNNWFSLRCSWCLEFKYQKKDIHCTHTYIHIHLNKQTNKQREKEKNKQTKTKCKLIIYFSIMWFGLSYETFKNEIVYLSSCMCVSVCVQCFQFTSTNVVRL